MKKEKNRPYSGCKCCAPPTFV